MTKRPAKTVEDRITEGAEPMAAVEATLAELEAALPLTHAVMDAWQERGGQGEPILRVTAKVAGFRRAGIEHSATATDHPLSTLELEQVEALLADAQSEQPNIVVEIV